MYEISRPSEVETFETGGGRKLNRSRDCFYTAFIFNELILEFRIKIYIYYPKYAIPHSSPAIFAAPQRHKPFWEISRAICLLAGS